MLTYEIRSPAHARDNALLIVLLHGRGSNRHDLFALAPHMPADAIVVAPEAPFAAAPWGYGPGSAWYQFLGDNRPEPDSFSASLEALETFLHELRGAVQFGKVVVGGFSQGGTTSLGYALTHPEDVAGVLNFSGFLADHPQVNPHLSETPDHALPIFWGHGMHDPAIPFTLAVRGREQLRAAGHDLVAKDYDIGHWIDAAELQDAVGWLSDPVRF